MINKLKSPLCLLCLSFLLLACDRDNSDDLPIKYAGNSLDIESFAPQQQLTYHFLLAEIAINRKDYQTAMEEYVWLAEETRNPVIAARATSLALEQELYEPAADVAKVWADSTPDDPQTQGIAVSILLRNKNINEAMPYLDRLVSDNDELTFANLMFIQATLENTADYEQYIELMRTHGEQHNDFRTTFMSAQAALEIGQLDTALETINQVLALEKDWIRPVALKIQILYETQRTEDAIAYLEEAIPLFPDNSALRWLQAQMFLDSGNIKDGTRILETLINDPLYRDDASIELARMAIQQQQHKQAEKIIEKYLKQGNITQEDTAYYLYAFAAQQQGHQEAALSRYRKVAQGPYFANANIQAALIYADNGYTDTALETLEPLFELYPQERSRIELVKTQILLDAYRIQEAYDELSQVINSKGDDTELRYIRGLIAIELEKTEQAESDFRYVVAQQPTHIEAINDLTTLLIKAEDYNDAMDYAKQAMDLEPENPESLANMGRLQYKLGKEKQALENLQKSYALDPKPATAAHLGEVLWSLGEKEDARILWQAALSEYPNSAELIDIVQQFTPNP